MRQWTVVAIALAVSACASAEGPAYGVPVRFTMNHDVVFSDFTIRYVGERRMIVPQFRQGFLYYDFEVKAGEERKVVSWTSGTGVIDSASFEIGGKPFELELRGSVARKGWLRDDEFVLWPRAQFLKALEASRRARE